MTVDVWMPLYPLRFDDLDLDARSQWVGKGKTKSALNAILAPKQAISIKLTTMVGRDFYVTLTLPTFIWPDQLIFLLPIGTRSASYVFNTIRKAFTRDLIVFYL